MVPAVLVVKTLKVLCPECGTEVPPRDAGATAWTPALVVTQNRAQRLPDFEPVEKAPMCHECGAFLELPSFTRANVGLYRPAFLPVPEAAPNCTHCGRSLQAFNTTLCDACEALPLEELHKPA